MIADLDIGFWMSQYGTWLVFFVTFASCLALPVPASLVMMTAGTFAASQDLNLFMVILSGIAGATAGDQTGYHLAAGLSGNNGFIERSEKIKTNLRKAAAFQEKWGPASVFLSRWLASPLGPWVNFASGLTRYNLARFTIWGVAGEIVWVILYVSLGYLFSTQIQQIADLVANFVWLLIAAVLAYLVGRKLFEHSPRH